MINESINITKHKAATLTKPKQIEKKLLPKAINGPANYDFITYASICDLGMVMALLERMAKATTTPINNK